MLTMAPSLASDRTAGGALLGAAVATGLGLAGSTM